MSKAKFFAPTTVRNRLRRLREKQHKINEVYQLGMRTVGAEIRELRKRCSHPRLRVSRIPYETTYYCRDCGSEVVDTTGRSIVE